VTPDYRRGWIDACMAINEALELLAPRDENVLLANYQMRNAIENMRNQVLAPPPDPVLTPEQQRLVSYGLRP
jgi:hypothetical protein